MSYGTLYSGSVSRLITLTPGSKTVQFSGTLLLESDLRSLDTLAAGGLMVPVESITDDDTAVLLLPWAGAEITASFNWSILRDAPSRLDQVEAAGAMTQAAAFASLINGQTRIFKVETETNSPPGSPLSGRYYLVGTAPTGWPVTVPAGSIVKRTGSTWGVISPEDGWVAVIVDVGGLKSCKAGVWTTASITGTPTTAGRLAYFTGTAGQLGQTQTSEDGSGNVATVGQVRSGASISAGGGGANVTGIGRAVTIVSTAADGLSGVEFISGGTLHGLTMFNNAGGEIGTVTNLPFYLKQNNATRVTITASAITAALAIAASAGITGTTADFSTRVTAGTIGALSLPLMIGGAAQFGAKAGPGIRYQPVSGKYLLTGINHDNNSLNAVGFSGTGSEDLMVDTSGNVTVRVSLSPTTDNAVPLGSGSFRFSVLYAGTGTINTSDQREKTPLRPLTEAERRVARRIFGMIGVFQWRAAVEEKGEDGARLHVGVTAQALRLAFEAEGLDAGRYGVWCRDMVMVAETRTRPVRREKMVEVSVPVAVVEIEDGKPVRRIVERVEERPAGAMVQVVDDAGAPLLDAAGEPLMHFVPEMEEVEETYTVEVWNGEVREGIRPDQLYAFVTAGAAEFVQQLQARIEQLEAA